MRTQLRITQLLIWPVVLANAICGQQTVTTTGGTVNVVPKYSGSATIINSAIFESGGKVNRYYLARLQPDRKWHVG
jgi:hypothetical protein